MSALDAAAALDARPARHAPDGAAPHDLRTLALAALAHHALPATADDPSPEERWLAEHALLVGDEPHAWLVGVERALREPDPADDTLVRVGALLGLSVLEVLSAALAAAVERDVMVGRVLAHLQAPLGGSRPMLSLLAAAFAPVAPPGRAPLDTLAHGPAVAAGLLVIHDAVAPLPERAVAVPPHLCAAFAGDDVAPERAVVGIATGADVTLPRSLREDARRHAAALGAAPGRVLVVRTADDAEGRAIAASIADALGRRPAFVTGAAPPGLGPWCSARALLPVFVADIGPGERHRLPAIPGYDGPVLALAGPDGSIEAPAGAVPSWRVPVPPPAERQRLWHDVMADEAAADTLARDHRHTAGRIAQLARLASHRAALDGRDALTADDLVAASRAGEGAGLDALAQLLPDAIDDDALVLPDAVALEMRRLLLRCRARDGLTDQLGASAAARYTPGVRALFVGPSGTGKTLAAGWLATQLGLPLFRVDLASVSSKYIGETEKNLAQLLARAERSEVVLLFDEADALFGKRTDIREANDRFANAQTNYLLQRIESFDGIAVLTSNSRARFDPAFSRRLDAIVDFPLPGPEERRSMWLSHLGAAHMLSAAELNRLSAAAHLSGGNIRNIVLLAAVFARAERRPIDAADIAQGLAAEYRKLGKQVPVELKA